MSLLFSMINYTVLSADKNNAVKYDIGTTLNAAITEDSPEIYYIFELEESGVVEAALNLGTWEGYSYELYDNYGNRLYREYVQKHTGDLTWDLSSGTYYLLFSANNNYGTFSLTTSFESANVNHDEDNTIKNNAAKINLNEKYNSIISADKPDEYFQFELKESGAVEVTINLGTWSGYSYELYDNYGNRLYREYVQKHMGDLTWDLSGGTYYLLFSANNNYGTFSFTLSDGGYTANTDKNNTFEPVKTPQPENNNDDDDDYIPITTPAPDTNNDIYVVAYNDVNISDDFFTAVTELSYRGIVNGYEDGLFKPYNNLTRAEFTKLIVTLLGKESEANAKKGYSSFSDVGRSHWALGYINIGVEDGIINGYGLGYFGPEDNVTYSQAVKMLVSAAGYEPDAMKSGGWPLGYMATGSVIGITEDMPIYMNNDDLLSRGEAAILMYNTLNIIE